MSLVSNKEESYARRLAERDAEIQGLKHNLRTINAELEDLKKFEAL